MSRTKLGVFFKVFHRRPFQKPWDQSSSVTVPFLSRSARPWHWQNFAHDVRRQQMPETEQETDIVIVFTSDCHDITLSLSVFDLFSHGFDNHDATHCNIDSILTCACISLTFFHSACVSIKCKWMGSSSQAFQTFFCIGIQIPILPERNCTIVLSCTNVHIATQCGRESW